MKIRAICEDNFLSLTYSFFVSNIVTFFVFLRFEKNKAMNIDVEYLEEAQSYIDAMPDKARIVVATHGFDKKTRKTPKQEIEHAESIRDNYYKTREENGD